MLKMPEADPQTLKKRASIAAALRRIVPGEGVIETLTEMSVYESDGLTAYRQLPLVVVLPKTTAEVAKVLRYAFQNKIKVVPRGAGTSLSGGALPLADGIVLGLSKFNRILEIDYDNRCAVVQPGVTNLAITQAVQHKGFYYAPDPSSQIACTIGGNVAENSGGVHCLKYGLTANNILGLEMVLISGEVIRLGGKHLDSDGLDLLGVLTGSEGLLGVITEVTVRLLQKPETARVILVGFPSSEDAGNCVADIISAGIIPGGMEMMDKPAIHAVEEFVHADYPLDVEALLIIELDGPAIEVDHLIEDVSAIARKEQRAAPRAFQLRRRSACCSGPGARRLSRRWGASRRIISAWMAPSRASACRKFSRAWPSFQKSMGCGWPMFSMRVTAICIRSFSMTPMWPMNWRGPRNSARIFCGSASRLAACSPASMGLASKSAI